MGEGPELSKLCTFHMFVREDNTWKGIRIVQAARVFSICSGKNVLNIKKEKTSPVSDLGTVWFGTAVPVCCLSGHQHSVLGLPLSFLFLRRILEAPCPSLSERERDAGREKYADRSLYIAMEWEIKEISYWRYPWLSLRFGKRKMDLCI